MNFREEYNAKLRTADEAVKVIKSGDWIDFKNVDGETGYWGYSARTLAYGALYTHVESANAAINAAYEQMDEIKSLSKTSLTDIVKGCYAAENAVAVMNAWSADDTNRASKSSVTKLLKEFHSFTTSTQQVLKSCTTLLLISSLLLMTKVMLQLPT